MIDPLYRGDKRSLRVEAQKQLWRLCRHYELMLIMIDIFLGKEKLIQDADTTFLHCSFDDLDNSFQFEVKWITRADPRNGKLVGYKELGATPYICGDPKIRNIMESLTQ